MYGHTDNYLRVRAKASGTLYNTISTAVPEGFIDAETLMARIHRHSTSNS